MPSPAAATPSPSPTATFRSVPGDQYGSDRIAAQRRCFALFHIGERSLDVDPSIGRYVTVTLVATVDPLEADDDIYPFYYENDRNPIYIEVDAWREKNQHLSGPVTLCDAFGAIGVADLILIEGSSGYPSYAVRFPDAMPELAPGPYIAVMGVEDAMPRHPEALDAWGSLRVDMNGTGQPNELRIDSYVEDALDANADDQLALYIDGRMKQYAGYFDIHDDPDDRDTKPTHTPLFMTCDLDGDGAMEIVLGVEWAGGDTLAVYRFDGEDLRTLYDWGSEEETRYHDENELPYQYELMDDGWYINGYRKLP